MERLSSRALPKLILPASALPIFCSWLPPLKIMGLAGATLFVRNEAGLMQPVQELLQV